MFRACTSEHAGGSWLMGRHGSEGRLRRWAACVLSGLWVCPAVFSQLTWVNDHLELTPGVHDTEARGSFAFANETDRPVTVKSVRALCSCAVPALEKKTYKPGERGEIDVVFAIGQATGVQQGTVYVVTDAPKDAIKKLTLQVTIPTVVKISGGPLVWTTGGPAQPKTLELALAQDLEVHVLGVDSTHDLIRPRLTRVSAKLFKVAVTPQRTDVPARAALRIDVTAGGKPKVYKLTAEVKAAGAASGGKKERNAIHRAVSSGNLARVKALLDAKPDLVNSRETCCGGKTPLQKAAQTGRMALVKTILERGGDVGAADAGFKRTALHDAALSGRKDIAQLLLERGADLDARDKFGWTPLHCAARGARPSCADVADLLISRGAEHDIFTASGLGQSEVVASLLAEDDQLVTQHDKSGGTPLHWATFRGRTKVMEQLIAAGAAPSAADKGGCTPLHNAANQGHGEALGLLLAHGCKVGETDKRGWTALHWAAAYDHVHIAEALLAKGADVNAKDRHGNTPLAEALKRKRKVIVKFLRDNGAQG